MSALMCGVFQLGLKVKMLNKTINIHCFKCMRSFMTGRSNLYDSRMIQGKRRTKLFKDIMEEHRQTAARSLLIKQLNPTQVPFKRTKTNYTFKSGDRYYTLVEFESHQAVLRVLQTVQHFHHVKNVTITSRFIFDNESHRPSRRVPEITQLGVNEEEILSSLSEASSLCNQMKDLHLRTTMSDLDRRLRFFLCYSLEEMLSGLLESCKILPFGSSVNGLGKYNCDLDMTMLLNDRLVRNKNFTESTSRFRYLTKTQGDATLLKRIKQNEIGAFGFIIKAFLPEFYHSASITQASVPIVNFVHQGCNISCDLSMENLAGHYMGELLWILGQIDQRFRQLMFTLRAWGKAKEVTGDPQRHSLSNYMLCLMLIHFLQTRPDPILPPIQRLMDLAENYDQKRIDDKITISFVSDYTKIPPSGNKETIGDLLKEFFNYYGNLDLTDQGICTISGGLVPKSAESADHPPPLHLVNPLEPERNAARIVNKAYLDTFQEMCREAFTHLNETTDGTGKRKSSEHWGLVGLFASENTDEQLTQEIDGIVSVDEEPKTDSAQGVDGPIQEIVVTNLFRKDTPISTDSSQSNTLNKMPEAV